MREEDAARFSFASEFVKGRVGAVKGEHAVRSNGDLAKIAADDASTIDAKTGTRNEFMKALGRKLDMTVTGFNAFRTDPQLRQIRTDLAERAEKTTFADSKGGSLLLPRSAAADGAARRRARDRPAARPAEAEDRRRRRLGSDHRGVPPADRDVLWPAVVQDAAVGRRVA